jgi:hypothetical protein
MIAIVWSILWHTILGRFAEIWIASLAPTFLVGYQIASRRRTASQVLGARRSPLRRGSPAAGPSLQGTGRSSSGAVGQRHRIGYAWALESMSVQKGMRSHRLSFAAL